MKETENKFQEKKEKLLKLKTSNDIELFSAHKAITGNSINWFTQHQMELNHRTLKSHNKLFQQTIATISYKNESKFMQLNTNKIIAIGNETCS